MHYPLANQPAPEKVESAAWVMVWNTGASPAVQLPALSNLDVNSIDGAYEVFSLPPGGYEVAGFRLDAQTAFDGLVRAIGDSGTDLGGLTPEQWVHADGAHLCVKVLVRQGSQNWPLFGATPFTEPRVAQKDLAPFAVDLSASTPDPHIVWRNFMVGDVLARSRRGGHRLGLRATGVARTFPLYLAVPASSFKRRFGKRAPAGFEIVAAGKLRGRGTPPFPKQVVLAPTGDASWLEIPALGKEYLAMSLGIELPIGKLRPGALGDVKVMQESGQKREWLTVGGCTLRLTAHDPRQLERDLLSTKRQPKGRPRPR